MEEVIPAGCTSSLAGMGKNVHNLTSIAETAMMANGTHPDRKWCERLGRLPDATLHDYLDAGFYRVMQPRRFGGYEFDLDTFLHVAIELLRGCPSSLDLSCAQLTGGGRCS